MTVLVSEITVEVRAVDGDIPVRMRPEEGYRLLRELMAYFQMQEDKSIA